MNDTDKRKKAPVVLIAAITAAVSFVVFILLWVFAYAGESVFFTMRGGDELRLECGESYSDSDVKAYFRLPFVREGIELNVKRTGEIKSDTLGRYPLLYEAPFMGKRYTAQRIINVVDTTAPVIELFTRPDYEPDWLAGYEEEGYKAIDTCDGDLTHMVEISRSDGTVEYTVTDSSGNTSSVCRDIRYTLNCPSISLTGGERLTMCALPRYHEPGYSATDAQGNDYTGYVLVEGQVNSTVPGDYELSYTLRNPSGDSISATRLVTVSMDSCPDVCQPSEKTIYLTFDDGPGPHTHALLDLLDAYGAKASFFVTGANSRYADCIKRAYEQGHSIGVHSFSHNYGYIYSSEENFFNDFMATQQLIYEQTGEYSQLFRFPGGSSNTVSRFNYGIISRLSESLEQMGYRYFDWNVNSGDADGTVSTSAIASNIIRGCSGKNCAVVLQHDIKSYSVDAVEEVLIWGRDNGYSFKALDTSSPNMHHHIAN